MTFGEPIRISGRDGPWHRVRADLDERAVAVLYARLADWRPDRAAGPRLRALLGRDWARYLDLTHPEVRVRFAASRVLIKFAAAAALDVPPEDVELGYRPTGRPYLRGYDGVDISLSHTEHELSLVEALPEQEREAALVRLWTLKEAYSKAIGQGMQFRFTDFGFGLEDDRTSVRRPDGREGTGEEWSFRTYDLDGEFVVSAAVGDVGFGGTADTSAGTMLDPSLVDAVTAALGDDDVDDADGGPDDDW